MALTTNYALHYFGGGVPGAITDDGSAFTAKDPVVLDKLIKALAGHTHVAESRLDDPSEAPAVSLATTGGGLAAGTTYYYVASWVDQFGLETAASAEVSVTTQGALDKPSAPILITNPGGSLAVGSYYYALTALAGDTETPLGPTAIITVSDFKTVNLTFPPLPDGATAFSVWRQGPRESSYSRIVATIDPVASPTFDDDGSLIADPQAFDPTHQPPTVNTTNATNAVTLTTPEASFVSTDPSPVKAWRIYRTTTSGAYPASSLVAEVRTTVNSDGTGGLISTFVDTGLQALSSGAPLNTSQTFLPPGEISIIKADTLAHLPPAGQYQDGVLALATIAKALYVQVGGTWTAVGGGGGYPLVDGNPDPYCEAWSPAVSVALTNGLRHSVTWAIHDLYQKGADAHGDVVGADVIGLIAGTEGEYTAYFTPTVTGLNAGDVVVLELNGMRIPDSPVKQYITVPPGMTTLPGQSQICTAFRAKAGDQIQAYVTYWGTGTPTLTSCDFEIDYNAGTATDPTGVVPGAPTNVTATPSGSGQLSVSFTAPDAGSAGPIIDYIVDARPTTSGPAHVRVSNSSTSIAVGDLTPGATYTVTVEARNAKGLSNDSTPVTATTTGGGSGDGSTIGQAFAFSSTTGSHTTDSTSNVAEAGVDHSHPVWYTFKPTTDSIVLLDMAGSGSDYDSYLTIYTGPDNATLFSQLTQVNGNDDGGSKLGADGQRLSGLSGCPMPAKAGQRYYVMIGDYESSGGPGSATATLNWDGLNVTSPFAPATDVTLTYNGGASTPYLTATWTAPTSPVLTYGALVNKDGTRDFNWQQTAGIQPTDTTVSFNSNAIPPANGSRTVVINAIFQTRLGNVSLPSQPSNAIAM